MPHQPSAGIPPTINVPTQAQNQWTGQSTFQQQGQRPRKRFQNGSQRGDLQPVQFIRSHNITYQHPAPPYQNQPMGGQGCRGGSRQGRHGGTGNTQTTHTNKIKRFHNLHYCFTCGYDVDHPGNTCPVADPAFHMTNIPCE